MSKTTHIWSISDCKAPEDEYTCSILTLNTANRVRRFLSLRMLGGTKGCSFHFHLDNEGCNVRRSIAELFTTCAPSFLGGKRVMIHWERCAQQPTPPEDEDRRLDAVPETKVSAPLCTSDLELSEEMKPSAIGTAAAMVHSVPKSVVIEQTVLLHLEFVPPDPDALPWPDEIWQEAFIEVPKSCSLTTMEQRVREVIVHNLQQDHELFRTLRDRDVNGLLTSSVGRLSSTFGQPLLVLDESEINFETISDFFQDPDAPDRAINVTVNLDLDMRLPRDPNQPSAKFSDMKNTLPTAEDRVVEKRMLSATYDAWDYVLIRLGTVRCNSVDETNLRPGLRQTSCENSNERSESVAIEAVTMGDCNSSDFAAKDTVQIATLIGYYIKGHMRSASDLYLMKVAAWDFDDYCIGDCDSRWESHHFSEHDDYLFEYRGVRSHSQLHKRVQKYLRMTSIDRGSGVPFMPLYTHNMYDPKAYGLGGVRSYTDVVVRFVNNLATFAKAIGIEEEPKLPWSVQYSFAQDETSASITKCLTEELRCTTETEDGGEVVHPEEDEDEANCQILFEKPLKDAWRLQLWVVPQSTCCVRKLFKFPSQHPGSADRLDEFLAHDKVINGDCRLYMEAHVVQVSTGSY